MSENLNRKEIVSKEARTEIPPYLREKLESCETIDDAVELIKDRLVGDIGECITISAESLAKKPQPEGDKLDPWNSFNIGVELHIRLGMIAGRGEAVGTREGLFFDEILGLKYCDSIEKAVEEILKIDEGKRAKAVFYASRKLSENNPKLGKVDEIAVKISEVLKKSKQ